MKRRLSALGLSAALAFTGCGKEGTSIEDMPGDIIARVPSKVVSTWYTKIDSGDNSYSGYRMFLSTEDCPKGVELKLGLGVRAGCALVRRTVDADTFRANDVGHVLMWADRTASSEVESRTYTYLNRPYDEEVYTFHLLLKQCIELAPGDDSCVTDFVSADLDTWLDAEPGKMITFSGKPGTIVSEH